MKRAIARGAGAALDQVRPARSPRTRCETAGMKRIAVAVAMLAGSARADTGLLEVGLGAPGGLTVGFGVRGSAWQAIAEVGGAVAGPGGMLSASVHLHRELHAWQKTVLALGVSMTQLGFMIGGEDVATGTALTFGPTLQLRRDVSRSGELVLDGGAAIGRCRGDCDPWFVMPVVTGRLVMRF
jgi:hypothetical protein